MINCDCLLVLQNLCHFNCRLARKVLLFEDGRPTSESLDDFVSFLRRADSFYFDKNESKYVKRGRFDPFDIVWALKSLEKTTAALRRNDKIGLITFEDPLYPSDKFSSLGDDAPLLLFYLGNPKILRKKSAAVIGTREPDDEYMLLGEKIANRLAKRGTVVVSGLALGCDSAGHRGCLKAGGETIAVLANGLDTIYPKENKGIAAEIISNGGCLVSEYPPKTRTEKWFFPQRDRLQAALSDEVIVVETDVKGGTMITVDWAKKLKRPLFALAPLCGCKKADGNRLLIENGSAKAIRLTGSAKLICVVPGMQGKKNKKARKNNAKKETEQLKLF